MSKRYKEKVRRKILAAAFKEFSKKGYDKTNLDDVARALKIARGTIYLYYDSKRAIFNALSEMQLWHLKELLERYDWTAGDIAATAGAFYVESKHNLPPDNERMSIEILAESLRNKELKRQRLLEIRKMQQIIVEVLQSQIGDPNVNKKEIREIALGAIALYNGLQMFRALGYRDDELQVSWARSISFLVSEQVRKSRKSPLVDSGQVV